MKFNVKTWTMNKSMKDKISNTYDLTSLPQKQKTQKQSHTHTRVCLHT